MSEGVQENMPPDPLPQADGPPHSWGGILLGFAGVLILAAVAFLLTVQFARSRPIDLKLASLDAADSVSDVLLMHQVPPGNILASEPELRRTPLAHYYHFEYDVLLPDTLSLGGMARLIERYLLARGVLTSEEESQTHLRALNLSMGDFPIATIKLSRTPLPQPSAGQSLIALKATPNRTEAASRQTPALAIAVNRTVAALKSPPLSRQGARLPTLSSPEGPENDRSGAGISPPPTSTQAPEIGESEQPGTWKVASSPPRLAIIVDDGGYGGSATDVILSLTTRLTLSILPNTPFGTALADEAALRGFEVMLHMPMGNTSGDLFHEGQIETHMSEPDIRRLMSEALAQVPAAVGVNNHMGSKFTAHADALSLFMAGLREEGLFFVDSRTTADSRAYQVAKVHGIHSAYRDLFLDHENDLESIRERFRELMDTAKRDGSAIGICHFRPNTASVLREMLPELRLAGIELVHVSELVR